MEMEADEDDADLEDSEPNWLSSVDSPEPDDTQFEPVTPSWIDQADTFDDQDDATWFENDVEPDDLFAEPEPVVNEFDDAQPDPTTEFATSSLSADTEPDVPNWLTYDPDDEFLNDPIDDTSPPPQPEESLARDDDLTNTVPEWLNAMVPGLDSLDFSPQAEEPIETEFIQDTTSHRARESTPDEPQGNPTRAFKWLIDIVDQEAESPMAAARRRPRFVFTRPPLWQRRRNVSENMSLDDIAGDDEPPEGEPAWLDDALDDLD